MKKILSCLMLCTLLLTSCGSDIQEELKELTQIPSHCTVSPDTPNVCISFVNTTEESIWTASRYNAVLQKNRKNHWISLEKKHELARLMSAEQYSEIKAGDSKYLSYTLVEYELERRSEEYRICIPLYSQNKDLLGYVCPEFIY